MTSLKDHQTAMVTLLASGSAIPTSAARLAHAMHDVLAQMNNSAVAPVAHTERRSDSTTSGLNDARLAADVAAVAPKQTSDSERVKQLENTCGQLRKNLRIARSKVSDLEKDVNLLQSEIEQLRGRVND